MTLEAATDDVQVGSVFRQQQPEETTKQTGYWLTTLKSPESQNDTVERECLAMVWAVLRLWSYLEGSRFTVRTDLDSLMWLLYLTDSTVQLKRWRLRLSEFEFDVIYWDGIKFRAADALFRLHTLLENTHRWTMTYRNSQSMHRTKIVAKYAS